MPDYNVNDFQLFQEEFHTGRMDRLAHNIDVFGTAVSGDGQRAPGIMLESRNILGDVESSTHFDLIPDIISDRDPGATGTVDDTAITDTKVDNPKINKRYGPLKFTEDQWLKKQMSPEAASFQFGEQAGDAQFDDYLKTVVSSAVAALRHTGAAVTYTHDAVADRRALIRGLRKMGDRMNIATWLMSSGPYFDIMEDNEGSTSSIVAAATINEASNPMLGKPSIVTDIEQLQDDTPTEEKFYIIGLAPGALRVTESEGPMRVRSLPILGEDNLAWRIQGEHAFNLNLKGYGYNVATGGVRPNLAALSSPANWLEAVASHKDRIGCLIEVNQA